MYANLVSASGLDLNFEQRELAEGRVDSLLNFIVGYCFTSAGPARSHTRAAECVAADGSRYGTAIGFGPAVNQRDVSLLYFSSRKFSRELAMGYVIFRNNDQSAGFFVQ